MQRKQSHQCSVDPDYHSFFKGIYRKLTKLVYVIFHYSIVFVLFLRVTREIFNEIWFFYQYIYIFFFPI